MKTKDFRISVVVLLAMILFSILCIGCWLMGDVEYLIGLLNRKIL